MKEFHYRVLEGAAWLDAHLPGWWRRVNLDILRMEGCDRCVLGQLYGWYSDGLQAAGFSSSLDGVDWAHEHGFNLCTRSPWDVGYEHLTTAWRELIAARRAQQEEPKP